MPKNRRKNARKGKSADSDPPRILSLSTAPTKRGRPGDWWSADPVPAAKRAKILFPNSRAVDGIAADDDTRVLTDEVYHEINRELATVADRFERYYREHQKLAPEDWEKFWKFLHHPLCVSFRFNADPARRKEVEHAMLEISTELSKETWIEETGRKVPAPTRFKFAQRVWDDEVPVSGGKAGRGTALPATVAFQFCYDPKTLSRHFAHVSKWLTKHQRDTKLIQRQETVSMFPVYLLGVQPGHKVLDLCASPGSKTTQALERLLMVSGRDEKSGFLLANEFDAKRACTLAKRLDLAPDQPEITPGPPPPTNPNLNTEKFSLSRAFCAVTHHRAQIFPDFGVRFDRIICDVPCSGDGTVRKYEEKWRSWTPHLGRQLHSLQLQILLRGMRLLRVGGFLCYSTCSLNPLENEAVVRAALVKTSMGGKNSCFEVVDVHRAGGVLPCRVAKGLRTWKVVKDEDCRVVLAKHDGSEEGVAAVPKTPKDRRFRRTMWPDYGRGEQQHEQWLQQQLSNCVRLMPQYANTGAFFCCLLRKVRDWPSGAEEDADDDAAAGEGGEEELSPAQEEKSGVSSSAVAPSRRKLRTTFQTTNNRLRGAAADPRVVVAKKETATEKSATFAVATELHDVLSKPHPLNVLCAGARLGRKFVGDSAAVAPRGSRVG